MHLRTLLLLLPGLAVAAPITLPFTPAHCCPYCDDVINALAKALKEVYGNSTTNSTFFKDAPNQSNLEDMDTHPQRTVAPRSATAPGPDYKDTFNHEDDQPDDTTSTFYMTTKPTDSPSSNYYMDTRNNTHEEPKTLPTGSASSCCPPFPIIVFIFVFLLLSSSE